MRSGAVATALLLTPAIAWAAPAPSTSVFTALPDDPRAFVVKGAVGDGKADDTAAIQTAIDAASRSGNSFNGGIVFLPSGRYRLTRSLLVPPAVRIFGVGKTRPVFVLAPNTPGFQKGVATMVVFTGGDQYAVGKVPEPVPTTVPFNEHVRDANSATFYSSLGNVDFEIGDGNPAAAGVRFRNAQHAFLSNIDFHIGSGLAGVYMVGNEAENVRFFGGRYGILTEKTSPAWQFTLIDSHFEGQRDAAIREHEPGLTLVNVAIRNTPVGIEIDRGYGDWLWGKDVRFENVSKAAVIISNEGNAYTQVGFDNALASKTPTFALFRDSGKTVAGPGAAYRVKAFNYGLTLPGLGAIGQFATNMQAEKLSALPKPRKRAIRPLPPMTEWVNVHSLGAKGDGSTDDTAAIQKAIDTNRVLYFPAGHYMVSDTIRLRPDSVLVSLHPNLTQLDLPDGLPNYAGVGNAKALLESAPGGDPIVFGLGLWTGNYNPRATALLWKAGENSLVDDVKIQGGGGTFLPGGKRLDMNAAMNRSDGQHPSIWIDGGGGTFASIWSPNTFAQAGFYVTNTRTPGHVYQLSAEHHYRAEIVLDGVENWEFLAPQTEQEVRDGVNAISTEIRNSRNILFANYHGYRVTRTVKPMDAAVKITNSGNIRFRNVHVNGESGYATCDANGCGTYLRASKFPFENAIKDITHGLEVREREFAVLDVPASPPAAPALATMGAPVEKLADGFYSISGAAVDPNGKLHFVEHQFHRIYAFSKERGLEVIHDAPLDPVNLAFDKSGNLMVLSSDGPEGTVYSFRPGTAAAPITIIKPTPVAAHPGALVALPANFWNNGEFKDQLDPETYEFTTLAEMFARDVAQPKTREYVSPDGSLVLPAFRVFEQGPSNHIGWRFSDTLDTYGFVTGQVGQRVTIVNGSEDRTFTGLLGQGGAVTDLKPIADRGGESVAVDAQGNAYVANGQIFVYAPDGKALGRIDVPERPLQLIFGGPDRRTLYILTHHSLYAVRT